MKKFHILIGIFIIIAVFYLLQDILITKESFTAFYPFPSSEKPAIPKFTEVALDPQVVFTPIKNSYLTEKTTITEIQERLDLTITSKLSQPWTSLFKIADKYGAAKSKEIITFIENNVNQKVVKINLLECASPMGGPEPLFYSKWDIVVHSEAQPYGFAFETIFLHIDGSIYLCNYDKLGKVPEDVIILQPSSSSSSAFSP